MTLNQFLVEQEGGCWHEVGDYADMNPDIDVDIDKYQCKKCKIVSKKKDDFENPDFSKWQNFGMLLSIAQAKGVYVKVDTWEDIVEVKARNFDESKNIYNLDILQIPKITAELFAKALGWREKE